jgi:hypothetical protein
MALRAGVIFLSASACLLLGVGASSCQAPDFRDRLDDPGSGAGSQGGEGVGAGPGTGGGGADASGGGGSGPVTFDVNVEMRDQTGAPLQSRQYLVSDADGAPVTQGTLSVNGSVNLTVNAGWLVTVFEPPSADDPSRHAYAATMAPGTTSVKFIHEVKGPPPTAVNQTVSAYCGICGSNYTATLSVSCRPPSTQNMSASLQSWMLNGYEGCAGSNAFDAYIVATNASGQPIAATSELGLALGTSHQLDEMVAVGTTVDLTWNVSGAPGGFNINRSLYVDSPAGREAQLLNRQNDTPTATIELVPAFVDGPVRLETIVVEPATFALIGHFRRYDPFDVTMVDVDVAAIARPGTPVDDSLAGRAGVAWTLGSGPQGDAIQVLLGNPDTVWTLALPPATAGTTHIPELEGDLAAWAFDNADLTAAAVLHLDEPVASGYAQFLPTGVTKVQEERRDLNELVYAVGAFFR